jgi:hypothetical protein
VVMSYIEIVDAYLDTLRSHISHYSSAAAFIIKQKLRRWEDFWKAPTPPNHAGSTAVGSWPQKKPKSKRCLAGWGFAKRRGKTQ